MFPQRQILRSAPRFLRSPAVQRRFMSSPAPKAGENAFIKEREAVKHHAAGTTGESSRGPEDVEGRPIGWEMGRQTDKMLVQNSGRRSPSSMTSPALP